MILHEKILLNKNKIAICTGIAILLVSICFIYRIRARRIDNLKYTANLPRFRAIDLDNKIIKYRDMIGKYIYVQFIDPDIETEILLLEKVYADWIDNNLKIIVIPNKITNKLKEKYALMKGIIIFKPKYYEKFKKLLKSTLCCDRYYFYGLENQLISTGYSDSKYNDHLEIFLRKIIYKGNFNIDAFIKINSNIRDIDWFGQIEEILNKNNRKYNIIGLFSYLCDSCFSGSLIGRLNNIHNKQNINVLAIMLGNYNDRDIDNIKKQLYLRIDIYKAESKLNNKWRSLVKQFSETELSDIVIIVDEAGLILKAYDKNCNCYNELFSFVKAQSSVS
jgi:hypothetical protein